MLLFKFSLLVSITFRALVILLLAGTLWFAIEFAPAQAATPQAPLTCRVGVYVTGLRDLNLADKSFSAEFWVWSVCPSETLKPLKSFKVLNVKKLKSSHDLVSISKNLTGSFSTKEKLYWSQVRINAIFSYSWNVSNYPFDRHTLTIPIQEAIQDTSQFVYTPDFDHSGYQLSSDLDGWKIARFKLVEEKVPYATTFGNPELTSPQNSYSRLVVSLDLQRVKLFSFFKLTIGVYIAFAVAMLSFFYDSKETSLASPRRAIFIGSLFAALLNMRVQETVIGRTEDLTLFDQIHIATILYIFGAGVVAVYSRLTSESGQAKRAKRLDRRFFFQLFTLSFVVLNVIAIAYAVIVG
ncbi:MAG: hypothetical protein LH647_20675 [Leptolyngbyaceae cyanobacterium CAN_BIN12]|nr:hypothetical protein [Leptolyngbyaceae cyanobacterium CAN_BIN12]